MDTYNAWLVVQWKGAVLEIQGIYDNEELAVASCESEQWLVYPMVMNKSLPAETITEGGYFPLAKG